VSRVGLEREDERTCSVYANVAVDEGVPGFVPVEDENGVEDEENEQAGYEEEEDGDVEDAPPRKGIASNLAFCAGVVEEILVV
jgi:hypothetical protein